MSINTFIKGNSRPVCLIGNPVAHSISPQMHNHIFQRLGLPYVYIPLPVAPQALHAAIFTLRHCLFAGANITLPYKSAVVPFCDRISDLSKVTGTVNTLYFADGLLYGTTTDPVGFTQAVTWMGTSLVGAHVIILGNGGTARTLAAALAWEKQIASLTIAGRNMSKVAQLTATIKIGTAFDVSGTTFDTKHFRSCMDRCTLLVNTTSVGMHPYIDASPVSSDLFHPGMAVFDAIYNPSETRFLREARLAGCKTQSGLRMLLYQGLASSKLWTGIEVPEELFTVEELEYLTRS